MGEIYTILVEPLYEGNIGYIARLSYNFNVKGIYMIGGPRVLGNEAISRAMHGIRLLDGIKRVSSLEEAKKEVDYIVGTSAVSWFSEKSHERIPMNPRELGRWAAGIKGKIGIVFGREDKGLNRAEIKSLDIMVTIPANPIYPTLSISHAASIILYELFSSSNRCSWRVPRSSSGLEKEILNQTFNLVVQSLPIRDSRKRSAAVHFRRIIARSSPTSWEFYSLMGVFRKILEIIENRKKHKGPF